MTDETKKPDEIDQAALDAHPEEQQGNDAGGASSDEQSTEGSAAPVADGASAEGNVDGAASSQTGTESPIATAVSDGSATDVTASSGTSAGNAAAAAADGAQAAGDAPVDGGDVGKSDAAVVTSPSATAEPDAAYVQQEASASADTSDAQAVPATDASVSSSDTATEPEPLPLGAGGVIVPGADSTPEDQAQLAAADKVGATVEDDSGNVVAGGSAPVVVTASPSNDTPTIDPNSDEHPLKTRARWLRLKYEREEAVVLEHVLSLLRDIEETL